MKLSALADAADAEAISEAVIRKTMRFVPVKSIEQQTAALILKTRGLLVPENPGDQRTARSPVRVGYRRRHRHGESCGSNRNRT
jgi:hypothetical protein